MLGGEPVEAGVEDEGLAAGGVVGLDLAEEHHVVACSIRPRRSGSRRRQMRHRALEHRQAVSRGQADAVNLSGPEVGELAREVVLVGGQHVDREAGARLESGQDGEERAAAQSTSGGFSETDVNELAVIPNGRRRGWS